jgi:Bacterial extracellular solute-binding proteins, family 5 Middle
VAGYKQFGNIFGTPLSGDPNKAKQLLQQARVPIPYPIHLTYSGGTPTTDASASALKAAYEKAGFKVSLEGLTDTYYDVIQNPNNANKYDLTWAAWGADWPNASTNIPPLFDGRVNPPATRSTRRSTPPTTNPTQPSGTQCGVSCPSRSPRTSPTSPWTSRSSCGCTVPR